MAAKRGVHAKRWPSSISHEASSRSSSPRPSHPTQVVVISRASSAGARSDQALTPSCSSVEHPTRDIYRGDVARAAGAPFHRELILLETLARLDARNRTREAVIRTKGRHKDASGSYNRRGKTVTAMFTTSIRVFRVLMYVIYY